MWKERLTNYAIGVATALILLVVFALGLNVYAPTPDDPRYNFDTANCATGDQDCFLRQIRENHRLEEEYRIAREEYITKVFPVSIAAGFIFLVLGLFSLWLKFGVYISAGIILAGALVILYGSYL